MRYLTPEQVLFMPCAPDRRNGRRTRNTRFRVASICRIPKNPVSSFIRVRNNLLVCKNTVYLHCNYSAKCLQERLMLRKLFKTGNSIVVSLPKDITEPLGVSEGTDVSVELDRENQQIIIRPAEHPIAGDGMRICPPISRIYRRISSGP